jgi:antitoxin (DNA-binding transcriptional repressor) of toxin-antitoxin stability system
MIVINDGNSLWISEFLQAVKRAREGEVTVIKWGNEVIAKIVPPEPEDVEVRCAGGMELPMIGANNG